MHTYEVLADVFRNEGVDTCFALLGDANMNWAAAMVERDCQFIYVRDEHCAVAAAMSWSRVTGKTGIATVTCGPGVTQIMTALPAAVRANIPLLIFAGEAPLSKPWYNQQIEQRALVEACGAIYIELHHAASMPSKVRDAFLTAQVKSMPVVLGVPFDLQALAWQGVPGLPIPSRDLIPVTAAVPPGADDAAAALSLIRKAQRIVVMAGRGAVISGALDVCKSLAANVDGLLATTLPARGAFHDDPFCIGIAGGFSSDIGRRCLQQADLVIGVGCSLAQHNSDNGKLFDAKDVLHIDLQPLCMSQGRAAASHHICCDARLGVTALLDGLDADDVVLNSPVNGAKENGLLVDSSTDEREPWRTDALAREIETLPADAAEFDIEPDLLDPRDVVAELNRVIPEDSFLVNSSGHCSYFFAHMPGRPVDRFLTIREFGAIGNGVAFAIGVAKANPARPVVLFDGDGSLLMHIQELETIRRHNLNVLICILNDGAYGSEIHKLRAEGLAEQGAVFGRPDFASIANGFGIGGAVVSDLGDLDLLAEAFSNTGGAAIWDFHVSDKVVSPVIRRSHA